MIAWAIVMMTTGSSIFSFLIIFCICLNWTSSWEIFGTWVASHIVAKEIDEGRVVYSDEEKS
jgi:hypothetical protein